MKQDSLPIDARVTELFASIDAQDGQAFVGFLTENAMFRFGSGDPVHGRADIKTAVEGFWESIAGCSHDVQLAIRENNTMVCEGLTTYLRHDGSKVTVPFADVFEIENELISEYKIYADIAPLFAE